MTPTLRPYLIGGAVGALLVGCAWWFVDSRRRPVVEQLPPEVVEKIVRVETVKEIPGPVTVVERVKWQTRDVPVDRPVVQEVVRVVERAAELGTLFAQIEVNGDKHVGRVDDRIVAGWVGEAACRVRAEEAAPWTELVREPFDQSTSVALSEIAPRDLVPRLRPRLLETAAGLTSAPGVRAELRWYGSGRSWGVWGSADWVPPAYDTGTGAPRDTWTAAAGVSRRWGKR